MLGIFIPTAAVLLALSLLVALTLNKAIPSSGLGLIIAVGIGVIGNNIDRQASGGWDNYWSRIQDSLRQAMPPRDKPPNEQLPPDCQLTRFYANRGRLDRRDERKETLNHILAGNFCARTQYCSGHSLPQATSLYRSRAGLGIAAFVIGLASIVTGVTFVMVPLLLVGGLVGTIIAIIALSSGKARVAANSILARAGLIYGLVALIIGVQGLAGWGLPLG
jgi:hypothetical protein